LILQTPRQTKKKPCLCKRGFFVSDWSTQVTATRCSGKISTVHLPFEARLVMRTTVTIDDKLFQSALVVADPGMSKSDIFREAIDTFLRARAAKRLTALGGKMPEMRNLPRRRERSAAR
jgi:Arc/MetJ family transcription regulator